MNNQFLDDMIYAEAYKPKMSCLRGRIIVDLTPQSHIRESGLVILDRKNTASCGKVIAIGAPSEDIKHRPIKPPCAVGQTVYFKRNKPKFFKEGQQGQREGLCMVWFYDVISVLT